MLGLKTGNNRRIEVLKLTWLIFDVVLGTTFGRDLANIDLLIQDLHLGTRR